MMALIVVYHQQHPIGVAVQTSLTGFTPRMFSDHLKPILGRLQRALSGSEPEDVSDVLSSDTTSLMEIFGTT